MQKRRGAILQNQSLVHASLFDSLLASVTAPSEEGGRNGAKSFDGSAHGDESAVNQCIVEYDQGSQPRAAYGSEVLAGFGKTSGAGMKIKAQLTSLGYAQLCTGRAAENR